MPSSAQSGRARCARRRSRSAGGWARCRGPCCVARGGLGRCADGVNAVAGLRDKVTVRTSTSPPRFWPRTAAARWDEALLYSIRLLAGHAVLLGDLEADELHDSRAGEASTLNARRARAGCARSLRGGVFGVDDHVQTDLAAQDRRVAALPGLRTRATVCLALQLFPISERTGFTLVIRRGGDDQVGVAHTGAQQPRSRTPLPRRTWRRAWRRRARSRRRSSTRSGQLADHLLAMA